MIDLGDGSGGDAKASDKADLVVAIAAPGEGSGDGGNAEATNTQPGGVAIALGGDGGTPTPASDTGGDGGKTKGDFGDASTIQPGSKGSPGHHGGGGWLFLGDSGTSGKRGPWAN